MLKKDRLEEMMDKNNGYLVTSEVAAAGISKTYLAQFVREHSLERMAHGVYMSDDAWADDYYTLYVTNKKIVFSHESALYLYDMMEREPSATMVTVPAGYNATHLRSRGIRVYQVKPELYEIGISRSMTNMGHEVAVYDRERTLCDTIRYHDDMDTQTFRSAMREYMWGSEKNLRRLMQYAAAFGIKEKVLMYTEVML